MTRKPGTSRIFGPVPSRRLGRSLGVDLLVGKTCSYDCRYCQIGRTGKTTLERREWVPPGEVVEELEGRLHTEPDVITLSGSGEPTLHAGIGRVIESIRRRTKIPLAVITNGSLLWMEEVRRDLRGAHLVIPSLDAGDAETFERVNRPHPTLDFETMVEGLERFVHEFEGTVKLEVLVLKDLNDSRASIEAIAARAKEIRPDLVQIHTVTRPPAESEVRPVEAEVLSEMARCFSLPVEVVHPYEKPRGPGSSPVTGKELLAMIERRPCSLSDIESGLRCGTSAAVELVEEMVAAGRIVPEKVGRVIYYKPAREE